MYHPYIIDTTHQYNVNEVDANSLKTLARKFLGREIQLIVGKHDPFEDALATLDLVKMKLRNGGYYLAL